MKKALSLLLALTLLFALCACGAPAQPSAPAEPAAPSTPTDPQTPDIPAEPASVTLTDMIGRELQLTPGSYSRVVCIGAGALRMYCYVGDTALLCGVEDIDNPTLDNRPKMFDSVARPYMIAYADVFSALPSCGVGGPNAQAAEAEMILSCNPDIVISEYEDV